MTDRSVTYPPEMLPSPDDPENVDIVVQTETGETVALTKESGRWRLIGMFWGKRKNGH